MEVKKELKHRYGMGLAIRMLQQPHMAEDR